MVEEKAVLIKQGYNDFYRFYLADPNIETIFIESATENPERIVLIKYGNKRRPEAIVARVCGSTATQIGIERAIDLARDWDYTSDQIAEKLHIPPLVDEKGRLAE